MASNKITAPAKFHLSVSIYISLTLINIHHTPKYAGAIRGLPPPITPRGGTPPPTPPRQPHN